MEIQEMPEGLSENGKRLYSQMNSEGGRTMAAELDKLLTGAKKRNAKREKAKAADLKRAAILEALAAGSITQAAELAGVSRKTIYSYMNTDTEFITAYRDMKRGQVRDIAETMSIGAEKAAAFIAGLLDDQEVPVNVKLSAVKLLEIGAKYRETETAIDGAILKEHEPLFSIGDTSAL